MSAKEVFSILACFLAIGGAVPYIRAILRGQTKPAKASWIIWSGLDVITFASMFAQEALSGQIIGATMATIVVAALALKYGTPGWTKLDKFCLAGAIFGVILWFTFDSPLLGMMVSLGMNLLGAIPSFVSAWQDPTRENRATWIIFWLSCVASIIAIPAWTMAHAATPVTFLAVVTVMVYLVCLRPYCRRGPAA